MAPFGITIKGKDLIIAPFRPSKTLDNLLENPVGVMNYTDDACITEFTSGQSDRIAYMVETYKPSLGGTQEGCADGYVDDCSVMVIAVRRAG